MKIRNLRASDLGPYRELMLHAYAEGNDAFIPTPEERAAEPDAWWLKRIADPEGHSLALGAFSDGQLVGTALVSFLARPKARHKAQLGGMFVHESCRGQRLGRQLVDAALATVKARAGMRVVTLTVTEGNTQAIALYERCGFRRFGVEPMAIATDDGYKSKVHMWRPLGDPDTG